MGRRAGTSIRFACVGTLVLVLPGLARAQQPDPPPEANSGEPTCTTTTTVTTTCTGAAAPLAIPDNAPPPPQPAWPPPPQPAWPPPAFVYPPPDEPPFRLAPRTHVEMQPRYGLVAAGLSIFGTVYSLHLYAALMIGDGRLAVPVVGPLLLLGDSSCNSGYCSEDSGNPNKTMLVLDAVVQATSLIMIIAGAATKHKVTVVDRGDIRMTLVPTATAAGAGLAALGTF